MGLKQYKQLDVHLNIYPKSDLQLELIGMMYHSEKIFRIWRFLIIESFLLPHGNCVAFFRIIWQCVKTNSTPSVHIKIAGIYGCSSH